MNTALPRRHLPVFLDLQMGDGFSAHLEGDVPLVQRFGAELYMHLRPQLRRPTTREAAIELVQDLCLFAADAMQKVAVRTAPAQLACRPGCAACCHQHVGVTVPELLAVEAALSLLPAGERSAIGQDISGRAKLLQGMTLNRRTRLWVPCGLLDGAGRCRSYAARPLLCRGDNSYDAARCDRTEEGKAQGKRAWWVPMAVYSIVHQALKEALGDLGFLVELTLGVACLAEDPGEADRWLCGDAGTFRAARLHFGSMTRAGIRQPERPTPAAGSVP